MKQPKCRTCGKEHALGGCPEFQSTAARKDAQSVDNGSLAKAKQGNTRRLGSAQANGSQSSPVAGTQALPVDATSPKFDKKSWQRDYMREFRKGLRRREQK